jgi:capsular polysaccharide biosynthesis protein
MLLKIIIFAILFFVIYIKVIKPLFGSSESKEVKEKSAEKKEKNSDEIMVECEACQTYTSSKEAIIKNNQYFCSKECANL